VFNLALTYKFKVCFGLFPRKNKKFGYCRWSTVTWIALLSAKGVSFVANFKYFLKCYRYHIGGGNQLNTGKNTLQDRCFACKTGRKEATTFVYVALIIFIIGVSSHASDLWASANAFHASILFRKGVSNPQRSAQSVSLPSKHVSQYKQWKR
jgi:hypothetical protein